MFQQAEKFFLYDELQRTFIDNGKGTGRLAWTVGFDYDRITVGSLRPNLQQLALKMALASFEKQIENYEKRLKRLEGRLNE